MPNLGPAELIIILAIALIVFGPKKLPEIGRGIGNAMREFQRARNDFMESLNADAERDEPPRASSYTAEAEAAPPERRIEFPEPLAADDVDALPYGGEFHAVDGDSQPAFGAALPEESLAAAGAAPMASSTEGKV